MRVPSSKLRVGRGAMGLFLALVSVCLLGATPHLPTTEPTPEPTDIEAILGTARDEPTDQTEVVGLELRGPLRRHKLNLVDVEVLITSEGNRLLPLRYMLRALQVQQTFDGKLLTFAPIGSGPITLNVESWELYAGEVHQAVAPAALRPSLDGEPEIYLSVELVSQLLSMQLNWDDAQWAFAGKTNRRWQIWAKESRSLHSEPVTAAKLQLPEILPPSHPRRNSLDFIELRMRLRSSSATGESLDSVRGTFWGALAGGEYKLQLSQRPAGASEDTPIVLVDSGLWTKSRPRSQFAVGDNIIGFSRLTVPAIRLTGLRVNGLRGAPGVELTRGGGLQTNFPKPRTFEGVAPLGSIVELIVDGQVLESQEILPDVTSPIGTGGYRFDDVLLRNGRLNDVQIVITEPDGTKRSHVQRLVAPSALAPRGTLSYVGGIGTHRDRMTANTNGLYGAFRALYGVSDRLTLGATVGAQTDFFASFSGGSLTGRAYPELSTNFGVQAMWHPVRSMLFNAEVSMSQGNAADPQQSYSDTAVRIGGDFYVARNTSLRSQAFRFGPNFFNGQNLDVRDRQGVTVDGSYQFRRGVVSYAVGTVRNNLEQTQEETSQLDYIHAALAARVARKVSLEFAGDRLYPSWEQDPVNLLTVSVGANPRRDLDLLAEVSMGDGFQRNQLSLLLSGLSLPGISTFRDSSQRLRLRKTLGTRANIGANLVNNDFRRRATVFGGFGMPIKNRPFRLRGEGGLDFIDQSSGTQQYPYLEGNAEFSLDAYGRNRFGLYTRYERDRLQSSLLFSMLTSLDAGMRARLVKERVSPGRGGIYGRVFVDADADGIRDPGEPGLADVKVFINERSRAVTDSRGYFIAAATRDTGAVKVFLDLDSVPAIYSPSNGLQTAFLDPAKLTHVNLGVTPLITVSGTILAQGPGGSRRSLSGARVYLADESGNQVGTESFTATDGSYYIGDARPGNYQVVVDSQTVPDGLTPPQSRPIVIDPGTEPQDLALDTLMVMPEQLEILVAEAAPEPQPRLEPLSVPEAPSHLMLPGPEPAAPIVDSDPTSQVTLLSSSLIKVLEYPEIGSASSTELGTIAVNWLPWAEVQLGDHPPRTTPCIFEELPAGTYTLRMRHPELGEEIREIRVEAGTQNRIAGNFGQPGILNINAAPWAEVIVDGRSQGTTPLQLRFPAGTYEVELKNPEATEPVTYQVRVDSGARSTVSHRFRNDPHAPRSER